MTDNATHEDQSNRLTQELIRIPNPDAPIYRIFRLWHLEESLRLGQLVLVPPHKWDDPFEVISRGIAVERWNSGRFVSQVTINQDLPLAFAQCWSATAESDTLMRAYSRVVKDSQSKRNTCPCDEGVQVKSTPRKLLGALAAGTAASAGSSYMGVVQYLLEQALLQEIKNVIARYGEDAFHTPRNHAKLLLMKRNAFAHEDEVRLIYVQHRLDPSQSLLRVPIKPLEVFDEITFDPRLEAFERIEREAFVRNLGYTGAIGQSLLYQGALLQVVLGKPAISGCDDSSSPLHPSPSPSH